MVNQPAENTRNTAALAELLSKVCEECGLDWRFNFGTIPEMATRLAAYGALVPSALTDEQTSAVWWKANLEDCRDGEEPAMLAAMRSELGRIAKGESA